MGVVLAGGDSTRMGCNKALLPINANETLLERTWKLVSGLTGFCVVSCAAGRPYAGFACIEDLPLAKGPCRGILSCLLKAKELGFTAILALACDLPGMTASPMRRLLAAHASASPQILATLYQSSLTGRIEMLAGVYSTRFLPCLQRGMKQGIQSLYWLLPPESRQCLSYGPELKANFRNCNTRTDLENFTKSRQANG